MSIERPISGLQRLADRIGVNRWFVRPVHRYRRDANPGSLRAAGKLLSPAESLLDLLTTIGPDSLIPDKPYLGRPRSFPLKKMLRVEEDFTPFVGGVAMKFYLAPYDLHYVIAPCDMTLRSARYVPGWLFPLFLTREGDLRNERLTMIFDTAHGWPMAYTMIASLCVAGMVCELQPGQTVRQGERIGHFRIGSSVVLAFPADVVELETQQGLKLKLGEPIGTLRPRR